VTYQLAENGCAVSSGTWNGVIPWASVVRILKYPYVLLLEIRDTRSRKEIIDSFKAELKQKQSVAAAQDQTSRGFPVFWAQPVALRSFLVLPKKNVSEEHASFIGKIVKERT